MVTVDGYDYAWHYDGDCLCVSHERRLGALAIITDYRGLVMIWQGGHLCCCCDDVSGERKAKRKKVKPPFETQFLERLV